MKRTDQLLTKISLIFWPEMISQSPNRRYTSVGDVIGFLYTFPLGFAGLIWLISLTDIQQITAQPAFYLFNFLLILLFSQVNYFIIVELQSDRFGSSDTSFATMIYWSSIFLFGVPAIWLMIAWLTINFTTNWVRTQSKASHWEQARNLSMESAFSILAMLVSVRLPVVRGSISNN